MLTWKKCRNNIDLVYQALQDEESRYIFDARFQYMIDQNQENYIKNIFAWSKKTSKKWRNNELENVVSDEQKIILYGCGHDGKRIKKVLEICGYSIFSWCVSNRDYEGQFIDGIEVISVDTVADIYSDSLLIIGSSMYAVEMCNNALSRGFPKENIFQFIDNSIVCAINGRQYFDIFKPNEKETFIDAGAYDGDTIYDFLDWFSGTEYKIISIEPLSEMCEVIEEKMKKDRISNVIIENYAAWNKDEMLKFTENARGSGVCNEGSSNIHGKSIDEIVGDEPVTYIKMDIEGAELNALEGAVNTIKKCHPKLAICIYHKVHDFYEIGAYLLSINPQYKFYIRHYSSCMWETVLYAYE